MFIDNTERMQAQVARYDQMRKELEDGFADEVLGEFPDLTHSHSFEAVLVDDPRLVTVADVGFDGSIERVMVTTGGDRLRSATLTVDPGSGLWVAMETWLADMRETWDGD